MYVRVFFLSFKTKRVPLLSQHKNTTTNINVEQQQQQEQKKRTIIWK